jgi:predicted GH43/DUF377 family glycosyl hydrolase
VLTHGGGGDFDERVVASPFVLLLGNGEKVLYFMGQDKNRSKWGVGVAFSDDLKKWVKYKDNPVFNQDMIKWGKKIDGPFIIEKDEKYYLFYESSSSPHYLYSIQEQIRSCRLDFIFKSRIAKKALKLFCDFGISQAVVHTKDRAIGFAVSKDGLTWKENSDNPILSKAKIEGWESYGVFAPKVYFHNGVYFMYYSASDGKKISSGLAFSEDLIKWEKYKKNPILIAGLKGEWDERCAEIISIIKIKDGFVLFYEGEDGKNCYRIGMAYSRDLVTWIKAENNPIVDIGRIGKFDDKSILAPHVVAIGDSLYLYYSAFDNEGNGSIGLAEFRN